MIAAELYKFTTASAIFPTVRPGGYRFTVLKAEIRGSLPFEIADSMSSALYVSSQRRVYSSCFSSSANSWIVSWFFHRFSKSNIFVSWFLSFKDQQYNQLQPMVDEEIFAISFYSHSISFSINVKPVSGKTSLLSLIAVSIDSTINSRGCFESMGRIFHEIPIDSFSDPILKFIPAA